MADYTIASSVNIEKGKQNEEYCVEQVISFQQQINMEKVFDEVVYLEESTLKKMDHVAVTLLLLPLEHFRTIDYVHVREGRLVYLQKFTGAG